MEKHYLDEIKNVDIHCHPTLKVWLFDKSLTDPAEPPDDLEIFDLSRIDNVYVSIPRMTKGDVSLVWASHYLPENGLIKNAAIFPLFKSVFTKYFSEQITRFENINSPGKPFEQTKEMIIKFEEEVKKSGGVCPHSNSELMEAFKSNKTIFLQTLEGGHHLGKGFKKNNGKPDIDQYIVNLEYLFEKGICSISLGHFFPNDLVSVVNGLPPAVTSLLNYPLAFPENGLSVIGKVIVNRMLEMGMIVDLIHSSPKTRSEIFEINKVSKFKRPLIFSHCGTAEVFKAHADFKHYNNYVLNPGNDEILAVKNCGGIIGLIFDLYWLSGKEEDNTIFGLLPDENGIPYIIESVRHIHRLTGTYDNIALGSDFDGFTDVIDDAPDISFFPKVRDALIREKIPADAVDKIMGQNAMRVIEEGWG